MEKYQWKATNLIAEKFEDCGFDFEVRENEGSRENISRIVIKFGVAGSGYAAINFLSSDDDNDVSVRAYQLISQIPEGKRPRMLEACNRVMHRKRYLKFVIDDDGDLNVEYDFPQKLSDDMVPEIALEMLVRMRKILDEEYPYLMKALYSDEPLD